MNTAHPTKGLLLINLGTPDNADGKSVRKYLKQFLADKRVIDLPFILKYALLYGFILPIRSRNTVNSYQKIWTKNGSPLRYLSQQLQKTVQENLKDEYMVAFGMRYGNPSIKSALQKLEHCSQITILPLYPQYSSAATGSAIEHTLNIITKYTNIPSLHIIHKFFDNPLFIETQIALIKPYIDNHDHILFSYHGLPERQIYKSGCKKICVTCANKNDFCYRSQCFATTRYIAQALKLPESKYSSAFQSRVGKAQWITPYTEETLEHLAANGVKKLAITCPSFITDCLETLEEIGIRANELWQKLTGHKLTLIPCANTSQELISMIKKITNEQ